jgi:hypothetical protein
LSKVKGVLLIPSQFENALPSFLVQGFNLMSSLKEHAIITVSKAAPVIQDIVNNVDQMVNVESKQSSHKKKFLKKMS